MTAVGKTLVFVNLVFSLLVGALVVMVYVARTNWADGFTKLKDRYDIANAERTQSAAEVVKVSGERDQAVKEKNDTIALRDQEIAQLKGNAAQLTKANEDLKKQVQTGLTNVEGSNTLAGGKATQAATLDAELKKSQDANLELTKIVNVEREKRVAADIERNSAMRRAQELENQVQDLAKQLTLARETGTVTPRGTGPGTTPARLTSLTPDVNPPPEDVRGQVKIVDKEHVVLSVGSDNGLLKGHTLEVFRLGDAPKYLGRIKILSVTANEAVGQLLGRPTQPLRVGDLAQARILP